MAARLLGVFAAGAGLAADIVLAGEAAGARRTTAVAYFPASTPKGKRRGRRARYGHKSKLHEWFGYEKDFTRAPSPVYGEAGVTLRYYTFDLLWRKLGRLVRFVWVIHPTRGRLVLLCTDLTLEPLQIIRLYGWRFKIEVSFKQAIHTVGAYAYHIWMQDMKPIRRGDGSQHPHRQSESYRQAVRRKLAAYERHIQLGLIAQGLLQYFALSFRRVVGFNFHSYIRTASPQKTPSEWVVSHALRHTGPEFLAGSPESHTLKKFLSSKISLDRCGYAAILELEKAA